MTTRHAFAPTQFLGVTLLVALTAIPGTHASALEHGPGYPPPSLEGFILLEEGDRDGDGDGIKETHILRYRDQAGDSVFSMTTKGLLWAWSRAQHGGGASLERNYVIRDGDCDGTFDERYGLDEQFHVPDCLK